MEELNMKKLKEQCKRASDIRNVPKDKLIFMKELYEEILEEKEKNNDRNND